MGLLGDMHDYFLKKTPENCTHLIYLWRHDCCYFTETSSPSSETTVPTTTEQSPTPTNSRDAVREVLKLEKSEIEILVNLISAVKELSNVLQKTITVSKDETEGTQPTPNGKYSEPSCWKTCLR